MRGRKPKPIEVHIQNGNPSRLNLKGREKLAERINRERPIPSVVLDKIAKTHWDKVIIELERNGILAKIDGGGLEALCLAYSNMMRAAKEIKNATSLTYTTKGGSQQQIPEIGIFNSAAKIYKSYCAEFGLSPSCRTRLNPDGADPDTDNPDDKNGEMERLTKAPKHTDTKKLKKLKPGEMWIN